MASLALRSFRAEQVPPPKGARPFVLPPYFPEHTPVDLEIGCGVGLHPIQYARDNPGRFLIAVERTREKYEKFARRLENHAPFQNLLPLHADAVSWVTHCLAPRTVTRCFFLYPNPEPRNSGQRWIRMPFLDRLRDVLKDEGEIFVASNQPDYLAEVRAWAPRRGFTVSRERLLPTENPAGRTHFERKYLLRQDRCFELTLTKAPLPTWNGMVV